MSLISWFKTDDKLPDHRKARAVRKSHPEKTRDVSPFGIWALAGAWSNDGFVPLEVLLDWDDDAEALADRLVAAKMWHKTKRDGEPGYIFHDWADHNPTRDDNDPSKSGTFGNHIRWHVQRQMVVDGCDHCPVEPDMEPEPDDIYRGDIAPMIAPTSGGIGGESLPSRPDPSRPRPGPTTTSSDKSDHSLDRFDEFWDAYGNKQGRKKCETAYRNALKKPGVTDDLLIACAADYAAWCAESGTFIKNPLTWLHGEHWRDERPARLVPKTRVQEHLTLVQQLAAEEAAAEQPTIPQIGQRR